MWKNLLLLLLLLAFCTAGCQKQYVEKTSGAAYQVVDSQGNVIKFAQKPQRIMTTHFNLDNIVMDLLMKSVLLLSLNQCMMLRYLISVLRQSKSLQN